MIREHDLVALTCDLPEHGLQRGDMGTVVHLHGDAGYGVEFMSLAGETIAVVSLHKDQVRPVGAGEIHHARPLESRA
jgi:Domain of unknown function (DUF4926)